jgi:hypothetical protein
MAVGRNIGRVEVRKLVCARPVHPLRMSLAPRPGNRGAVGIDPAVRHLPLTTDRPGHHRQSRRCEQLRQRHAALPRSHTSKHFTFGAPSQTDTPSPTRTQPMRTTARCAGSSPSRRAGTPIPGAATRRPLPRPSSSFPGLRQATWFSAPIANVTAPMVQKTLLAKDFFPSRVTSHLSAP